MKKVVVVISIFFLFIQLVAVPANPKPSIHKQPNGEEIVLRTFGDEWFHFYETTDGYTVIKNKDGFYQYAELGLLGELKPSGIVVHAPSLMTSTEIAARTRIGKHLRPSDAFMKSINKMNPHSVDNYKSNETVKFNKNGKVVWKVIVLLIQYPDLLATETVQSFHDMMVQEGYTGGYGATGSFNDYYKEISYGQFEIEADVYGWYMAQNGYAYYSYDAGFERSPKLVAEAVDSAYYRDNVDFSQYDNDNDGTVDQIIVVHSGPGAEEGGNTQYIWSHKWNLVATGDTRNYSGKYIDPYIIQPEKQYGRHCGIGVFCHEFGHALGLPDLYDTDNSSEGIGNWGLMGGGSWLNAGRTPDHMTPWCKQELQWINPVYLTEDTLLTMRDITNDGSQYFRIPIPGNSNQYFLLENRQRNGFNSYLPASGLLIWHVDESRYSNEDENRKLVDLEEADGDDDLDHSRNRGDAGDPYPTSTINAFTAWTYPSSNSYSGNKSYVAIENITEDNSVITADISLFGSADFSASVISGHAPLTVDFSNLSDTRIPVTQTHWDFNMDGTIDSEENNPQYIYDTPGRYSVKMDIMGNEFAYSEAKTEYIRVFDGNSAVSMEDRGEGLVLSADQAVSLDRNFTIEFMLYPTKYGMESSLQSYLFDKYMIQGYLRRTATLNNPDSSFVVTVRDTTNQTGYYYINSNIIQMNQWQMISIVVSDTVLIYHNGVLAPGGGSKPFNGVMADNSTNDLFIGNNRTNTRTFPGAIDEFRIWKRALTNDEIAEYYNNTVPAEASDFHHYFKMNEAHGTTASDEITGYSASGSVMWEQGPELGSVLAADKLGAQLPNSFRIEQNYPNPFNPTTTIPLFLGQAANVKIDIYNALGQKLQTLINKQLPSGSHQIVFDASRLASGIYFYNVRIQTSSGKFINKVRKMMLLK